MNRKGLSFARLSYMLRGDLDDWLQQPAFRRVGKEQGARETGRGESCRMGPEDVGNVRQRQKRHCG